MKLLTTIAASALALSLAACGTADQAPQTEQNDQTNVQDAGAPEVALPSMVVARVPVDAEGNELTDKLETRVIDGDVSALSDASSADMFAQGSQVTIADELDEDSSADSWGRFYWRTPWYPGKALGRGLWWGRNPWVYRGGYGYGYRYYNRYYYGGYRYYCYNRW